jgi:hypothetical protein
VIISVKSLNIPLSPQLSRKEKNKMQPDECSKKMGSFTRETEKTLTIRELYPKEARMTDQILERYRLPKIDPSPETVTGP